MSWRQDSWIASRSRRRIADLRSMGGPVRPSANSISTQIEAHLASHNLRNARVPEMASDGADDRYRSGCRARHLYRGLVLQR